MEDFDINEFARMFDAAIASDNPSVQKTLRNFMMVAAIVHAQEQKRENGAIGPLETLVQKVAMLERIVFKMEKANEYGKRMNEQQYKSFTWQYPDSNSTTSGDQIMNRVINLLKDTKVNE